MNALEGYASTFSVSPGETIRFHVNAIAPHNSFRIDFLRQGLVEKLIQSDRATTGRQTTPANASLIGCGWSAAYTLIIPRTWTSGVYYARLTSMADAAVTTKILFVVKAAVPGSTARVLYQLSVNTYHAYNNWGGKSLYPFNSTGGAPATQISFDRPINFEAQDDFVEWELPFIQWLESQAIAVEYCTNVDLHGNSNLLNAYQLMLSVGHDEYWSWEMRDRVEAFIAAGGNVAFFSANTCWWQVRFENNARHMICHKTVNTDPMQVSNPRRTTVNWKDSIVDRPENSMTGVSFLNGGAWFNADAGARPAIGYQVQASQHWVFENTGLNNGDEFGAESSIIGYETDAAIFEEQNGVLRATGEQNTPLNFIVLATADLTNWGRGGQAGMATLGLYRKNGVVFTAATIDWAHGLRDRLPAVMKITENVIQRLSRPFPRFPTLTNANFEQWINPMTPAGWQPEGVGKVQQELRSVMDGRSSVRLDGRAGHTWMTQGRFECEAGQIYSIGGWVKCDRPGATIKLQTMEPLWRDFVTATHPGNNQWEFVFSVGFFEADTEIFPARVKLEVQPGVVALFDQIGVDRV